MLRACVCIDKWPLRALNDGCLLMKAKDPSFISIGLLSVLILAMPAQGDEDAAATTVKTIQRVGLALADPKFTVAVGKARSAAQSKAPECLRPRGENPGSARGIIQLDLEVVACDLFTFQPGPSVASPEPSAAALPAHDLKNPDGETAMFIEKTIGDIRRTIKDLGALGEAGRRARGALEETARALEAYVKH
jgi:hypothetical protein